MHYSVAWIVWFLFACFHLNVGLAHLQSKNRIPCGFDDAHKYPYNEEREKQFYELMVKRSETDSTIKRLMNLVQVDGNKLIGSDMNDTGKIITVPVIYHIARNNQTHQPLPFAPLQASIERMNKGFSGTDGNWQLADSKIRFTLQAVYTDINSTWYEDCFDPMWRLNWRKEKAIDPKRYLNIYICDIKYGILGVSQFPDDAPENDTLHGVLIHHQVFPITPGYVPFKQYNEGDIITHEVGHYFGLYHPFQGDCKDLDGIKDTPAMKMSFGKKCLKKKKKVDTCPKKPGLDSLDNYMVYTDDICRNKFTPLQAARMRAMTFEFRPALTLNQKRECVSGGNVGNVGSWKICTSKCFTTKTPNGSTSPANGWCYTNEQNKEWSECCCVETGCTPNDNIYGM